MIHGISIQFYMECLLVKHAIYATIKCPLHHLTINALQYYFHDLYLQINKNNIVITKKKPSLHLIGFNACAKKEKCAKSKEKIILFFYTKNKIDKPISVEIPCTKSAKSILTKIENIIKKDEYIKDIYKNGVIESM